MKLHNLLGKKKDQEPLFQRRYLLDRELGSGGAGIVYEAQDRQTGRKIAIKIRPPTEDEKTIRRFRREFDALSRLDDSHIVKVYEWVQKADNSSSPWII
jgi:serine/threonine protein kinase